MPSFQHALACIGLSHSMPFAHGERSNLGNFVFSVSILLNNPLYSGSFATEKILETFHQAEWDKQYRPEHAEKIVLLSNPMWSYSLNSLAVFLIFFKLFNGILIFNEKGRECYGLLHTPQCDKPCHLHLKRGHTWPNFCFHSLFYSIIHYTYAVLQQKNPEKNCMRLERDNPQHAGAS